MSVVSAGSRSRVALAAPGRAFDLAVVGALALVLRVAWVLVYGRASPPKGAINDTTFYQFAAASLASGHGYIGPQFAPTAGWPPGFPFLVSLLYRVFGIHLQLALALNVVLATATVVLLYLVAERIFGRTGARFAAGLFAILPGPLFFTGLWMSETTFTFILVAFLALVVFLPDRRWTPVVLGVALGLAALTRGEGMLMPIIPLAVWWGHHPGRAWLRRAGVLLAAMALTVAPWTIRNAIVMDAFIPVANNASWTLWSGHNSRATGGPVLVGAPTPRGKSADPSKAETEGAAELRRQAVRWAISHPVGELRLIPRKLLSLNAGSSGSIKGWLNAGPPRQRELGPSSVLVFSVLGDAFGYFLLLATLASLVLIGARSLWRSYPAMQGVLAYLALCLVNYGFVYYGQFRYRIPMEPFMILVATPLMTALWAWRRGLAADFAGAHASKRPRERRRAGVRAGVAAQPPGLRAGRQGPPG
jgi:4-amino-4-deoxy-L-arabinose transferase-like glycosyltransferase